MVNKTRPAWFFGLKIGSALEFAVPSRFDVFPLLQKIGSALRFAGFLDLDVGSRLLKQQFNLSLSNQAFSRCGVLHHSLNLLWSIDGFVGFVFVNRIWNFLPYVTSYVLSTDSITSHFSNSSWRLHKPSLRRRDQWKSPCCPCSSWITIRKCPSYSV